MNLPAPTSLVLLATVLLGGAPSSPLPRQPRRPPLPRAERFSALVLECLRAYPTDGRHGYLWPRKKEDRVAGWAGNTGEMRYRGVRIARAHPKGCCYCCGLTFELFFRAWRAWCRQERKPFRILDLDPEGLRHLRRHWFGANGDLTCAAGAITAAGLGFPVKMEKAKPGDFIQFWRHTGSGHSVVFCGWVRDGRGGITGLRYWSTQKATGGIGRRTERIGEPRGIDRERIHIARVGRRVPPAAEGEKDRPAKEKAGEKERRGATGKGGSVKKAGAGTGKVKADQGSGGKEEG